MAYGVTSAGFVKKTFAIIQAELRQQYRDELGDVNVIDGPLAQEIDLKALNLAELWSGAESVYNSQWISSADGTSLDRAAEYTRKTRLPALNSEAVVEFYGDNSTVIPSGTQGSVGITGEVFETTASGTITNVDTYRAVINVSTVVIGFTYSIVLNGVTYSHLSTAGQTATDIALALQTLISVDPVYDLDFTVIGSSNVNIVSKLTDTQYKTTISANLTYTKIGTLLDMTSVNTGEIIALTGTLTTIVTPVVGLDTISNTEDATLGRDLESDTDFRVRILASQNIAGLATIEGIKAYLEQYVDGVTSVSIIENDTDSAIGLQDAHSIQCVVEGGTDAAVAAGIFASKAAGINTYGLSSEVVTDTMGFTHTIEFSRPDPQYAWIKVVYTLNSEETFPTDGEATIAANILAIGNALDSGEDIILMKFYDAINSVAGVATAVITADTTATAGGPPTYAASNIAIASNELAVFDLTRITVSV